MTVGREQRIAGAQGNGGVGGVVERQRVLLRQARGDREIVGRQRFRGLVAEPFNYRDSVGQWWRSLFMFQPDITAIQNAPFAYQLHAVTAWAFWAAFPFTRLVHVWSVPLAYIGRPYILYRRRYNAGSERIR